MLRGRGQVRARRGHEVAPSSREWRRRPRRRRWELSKVKVTNRRFSPQGQGLGLPRPGLAAVPPLPSPPRPQGCPPASISRSGPPCTAGAILLFSSGPKPSVKLSRTSLHISRNAGYQAGLLPQKHPPSIKQSKIATDTSLGTRVSVYELHNGRQQYYSPMTDHTLYVFTFLRNARRYQKIRSVSSRFYYSDYFIITVLILLCLSTRLGFSFFSRNIKKKKMRVHKYIFTVR